MYSYVYYIHTDLYCLDFILNSNKLSYELVLTLFYLNSQIYHNSFVQLIITNVTYLRKVKFFSGSQSHSIVHSIVHSMYTIMFTCD